MSNNATRESACAYMTACAEATGSAAALFARVVAGGLLALVIFTLPAGLAAEVAQGSGISAWKSWLPAGDGKVFAREEPDFDSATALAAWAAQRDRLDAVAARWARQPAPLPWNDLGRELIVKYQQNPLRAARVLALLHAAMNDALIAQARHVIEFQITSLRSVPHPLPLSRGARGASSDTALSRGFVIANNEERAQAVAIHAAASAVLAYLYPQESPGRLEALGRSAFIAVAVDHPDVLNNLDAAWRTGRRAGAAAIALALEDGSDAVWNPDDRPAPAPGRWRSAPPLNLYNPLEPLAGQWRTWALKSGGEIQPMPPTPFGSQEYWREAEQVLKVARELTPDQKRIAEEWNLDRGTITPAGVWNLRAKQLVQARKLGTADAARLLAALNVAMMDAFIACWHSKFEHWSQRPVHAIRDRFDPSFLPHLLTPPFPGYVSGHSTISGAAAEVLAAFFPDAAKELREMAEEAALSRLYAGIHFQSDNDEGLKLGRTIGRRIATIAFGSTRVDRGPGAPASGDRPGQYSK